MILDEDIGCHIPEVPESIFNGFNWFLSSIRFGRLISKTQSTLFSVTATMSSPEDYARNLQAVGAELEHWRGSIPLAFRPGERLSRSRFASSASTMAALRTHFIYHNFAMVLCRLSLQVSDSRNEMAGRSTRETFMLSARRTIELTGHLEVEPYSPSLYVVRHIISDR